MPIAADTITGADCKLYRNTATHASPTWALIDEAQDVTINWAVDKAETSDRGSRFKNYSQGNIEVSISFTMNYKRGNSNFSTLIALATPPCAEIEFAAMDTTIATTGAQGLRAYCKNYASSVNQPHTDGVTVDMELAPCYHEEAAARVAPDWYVKA